VIGLPVRLRERNVVKKDWRKVRLRVALCYPNVYRAGMTSLAIHLLYYLFNARQDVACERVFYVPQEAPYSLESGQPLDRFDVVAFSLQFENDYARAVEMLIRARIPPLKADRKRPWVIAGGPCAAENPFPMMPFVDVFLIGELEPVSDQLIDALIEADSPAHLDVLLDSHFLLTGRRAAERVLVKDLDQAPHPTCQVLPERPYPSALEPTFGQSLLVEVSRGCDRHCNFCLTGFQCSPRRERSLRKLLQIIDEGTRCTGVDKVALVAAALADYSQLGELFDSIVSRGLQLSVPALRADLDVSVLDTLVHGAQRTLTLAPEAGPERLRTLVAKPITNERFFETFKAAIAAGFNQFKLYFLVGLPTETDEDVEEIQRFCKRLIDLPPRRHRLHVSAGPLIPKPHTPFQWYGLTPLKVLKTRMSALRRLARLGRIVLDLANPEWSVVEAALSRGTADLAPVILAVAQGGRHSTSAWFRAARASGIDLQAYAEKAFPPEEVLPWEMLDVGAKRNTLWRRYAELD
jgi:radical SAM superfamily enzyme YgiQ (UPF0313 family)